MHKATQRTNIERNYKKPLIERKGSRWKDEAVAGERGRGGRDVYLMHNDTRTESSKIVN